MDESESGAFELSDALDVPSVQVLFESLHQITGMPIAILDLNGKILVAVGWQEVCVRFHRMNPQTAVHCADSDQYLTRKLHRGESVTYKCGNQLWDMITPLYFGGKHVGNIFAGQFLYDDEILDAEVFRRQADRYGFDQDSYLAAVGRVPRLSRKKVADIMNFVAKLAAMISELIYGKLQLQRTLSEQQRTTQALQTSYSLLSTSMRDAFVSADLQGRITDFNAYFLDMVGYLPEEIREMTYRDFTPSKWLVMEQAILEQQVLARGYSDIYEKEYCRKDGSVFPVELRVLCMKDAEGNATGMCALVRDISERKRAEEQLIRSEEQYRTLVDNMQDVIYRSDREGNLIYVSPSGPRLLGYDSAEEMLGLNIAEHFYYHPENRQKLLETLRQNGKVKNYELELKRKDTGSPVYISTNSQYYYDRNGQVCGIDGIFSDITERKHLEAQLMHAQKMQAIGTLAGGIAHDFNNILSVIIGFSELLEEDAPDNADMRNEIGGILKACTRAKDLVKQILTFSRQTEGVKKPLRLQPLIQEAVNLLRASIPSTIEITCEVDSSCGPIMADATQIHQTLMNLSTNAYHALRDTGGNIQIQLKEMYLTSGLASSHPRFMPGRHAIITVSDNGAGMSSATLQRIFEPYFTTKGPGEGTGLGLAIVDSIIEQHGGAIDVSSELGRGTTFKLIFPICFDSGTEALSEFKAEKPLGTERVLFVDDEQDIVEVNRNGLQRFGYRVTAFSNPLEAADYFSAHPDDFDVVVTDFTMPKMTGTDLAGRIYALRPDLPLVLCSGFAKSTREMQGKLSGVWEFVEKPIQPDRVGWAIRRVMAKQQSR